MLPDFTDSRTIVRRHFDEWFRHEVEQRDPVLASVPRYRDHEGGGFTLHRETGDQISTEYVTNESRFTLDLRLVPDMTPDTLKALLSPVIDDMVTQQGRYMFAKIEAEAPSIKRADDESAAELHLRVLEGMSIAFDDAGNHNLSFVVHPDVAKRFIPEFETAMQDPEYKRRHDLVMLKKRMEWRDREASRRLVD